MATIKQIKDSAGATHDIVDTKNTAGSTNSSSKLYLIGATEQAENPQTYSYHAAYVDTDGCLYSNNARTCTIHEWTCEFQQIYSVSQSLSDYSVDIISSKQDIPKVGDIIKISFKYNSNLNGIVDPRVVIALSQRFYVDYNKRSRGELSIVNHNDIHIRNIYPSRGVIYLKVLDISNSIINAHMIYNNSVGSISNYAENADISNKTNAYQFCDYGNLYTGGTTSANPKIPASLQLSGDFKFVNGGRLIIKFNNNHGKELELNEGAFGLQSIIFPDNTSMPLTYGTMATTGYMETHMGDHYLDIIMYLKEGTKYGYLTGYSVPKANYADDAYNADRLYISASSSSISYPLVFTNNVTAGYKSLYTDSAYHLNYNPNTNTLNVPTASATNISATNIKASTIANKTSNSTIMFNDAVCLKDYSYTKGVFSCKGENHNNYGVYMTGGSVESTPYLSVYHHNNNSESMKLVGGNATDAPYISIKSANNNTTEGIKLTGRGKLSNAYTPAEIKVYGSSINTCTTIIGGSSGSTSSDERLKNFKDDVEVDFDKLKQIPKKYFTWKDGDQTKLEMGTSAQEVEKLYPNIVQEIDGYKSIEYAKLSIVALAAIDKLNERIEYLENKLKELE